MSTTTELTETTLLRFATAGSVDDGKSTLVGRLLHDSKSILTDQLEAVERASASRGAPRARTWRC
ncbi:sulfate adenylyltransferase subunit 1 (EFTu-like GTPase family) [Streptomyces pseudovenezuelae]